VARRHNKSHNLSCSIVGTVVETPPSIEQLLLELKARGLSPAQAIKELHLARGLSLAEAKHTLSLSPAWSSEATAADRLHEEILAALAQEPKS
jgi:hypothetical protein